jgi:hypothetical protein
MVSKFFATKNSWQSKNVLAGSCPQILLFHKQGVINPHLILKIIVGIVFLRQSGKIT